MNTNKKTAPIASALNDLIDSPATDRNERVVYYECLGALATGMAIADLEAYIKNRYIFCKPDKQTLDAFFNVYRIVINNRTT